MSDASDSGVLPFASVTSTSASFRRSSFATSGRLAWIASISGVRQAGIQQSLHNPEGPWEPGERKKQNWWRVRK
ncbi:hypothetical protein HYQ46_011635 [Verticillium longisporum]|nr:hypothetical protein HYQ46_011635 [Verticillium longisporum]